MAKAKAAKAAPAKKAGKKMDVWPTIGAWSFIIGLVIAVLTAVWTGTNTTTVLALGALGIIVGVLNVSDREVALFLLAAIVFVVAAQSLSNILAVIPGVGGFIPGILANIILFVSPAAAIVSLRAIYDVARGF